MLIVYFFSVSFGGTLALCIGGSLLSLVEIFYFFLRSLFLGFKWIKTRYGLPPIGLSFGRANTHIKRCRKQLINVVGSSKCNKLSSRKPPKAWTGNRTSVNTQEPTASAIKIVMKKRYLLNCNDTSRLLLDVSNHFTLRMQY